MNGSVLPLAITMMAGPQIMSAVLFVTHEQAVRVSLMFIAGVAIAATAGVIAAKGIASLLGDNLSLGDSSDSGSKGSVIQIGLVALLIAAAVKAYLGRETAEPPKWLGALMEASPRKAFRTGFLLIAFFPSDVLVLLTVGLNLEHSGDSVTAAIPFIALTVLIAALPLLALFLFGRRAREAMPKVRSWMNDNSWVINIAACLIFIVLILG
jgi:cytochrome c biogenesis protein CcdA